MLSKCDYVKSIMYTKERERFITALRSIRYLLICKGYHGCYATFYDWGWGHLK